MFSLYRKIVAMAVPITASMMSQFLLSITDTFMISYLGPAALAAVGICGFIHFVPASAFGPGM